MPLEKGVFLTLRRSTGMFAGYLSRRWPLSRGRDRLALIASRLGALPERLELVTSALGHRVRIDPEVFFYRHAFFTGIYEPGISQLLRSLVSEGATCVDVGANIGWHSLAMANFAGPTGGVHAFEPVPSTFTRLQANIIANGLVDIIHANPVALSDRQGTSGIRMAEGQPSTHASLDLNPDANGATPVETIPLDTYRGGELLHCVDIIKIDAEGAERLVVAGARDILSSSRAPVLIVEVAEQTGRHFGYGPNDLLEDIERLNTFQFFVIDEASGSLTPLSRFPAGHIGANVLALPASRGDERRRLRADGLLMA